METHHVAAASCPVCGEILDSMLGVGHDHAPSAGDVTICFDCRSILVWEGELRLPNELEMHEIAGDERILRAMKALDSAAQSDAMLSDETTSSSD